MAHASGRRDSHGAGDDWDGERTDVFDANEVRQREFSFCMTSKVAGRSAAYEYCYEIKIDTQRVRCVLLAFEAVIYLVSTFERQ